MGITLKTGLFCLATVTTALPSFGAEEPTSYGTPQEAFDAFSTALGDKAAVAEVFGTAAEDFLSTGDLAEDAANSAEIQALIAEGYRFQSGDDGRLYILLGAESWPFPVPLAKTGNTWAFDVEEGRNEVFFRHIGLNELETMDLLSAYVEIQAGYRLDDHDGDGVMEFASSILSSGEQRDGLVWADEESPLGVRVAQASLDGYNDGEEDLEAEPFGGYYYRILTSQGADASGGAYEYILGGNMVAGHALMAVPAEYGETGVHSFMVSENGVIYEADLGEDTLDIAFEIRSYNPSDNWTPVDLGY